MAKKRKKRDNITLDVEQIRVDASPEAIASMMSALIHIPSYRKGFEKNPVAHLKEVGIAVPNAVARQISAESIRSTLDELTEGGEERTAAAIPAVAVVIRVGTSPGTQPATRPGVSVGVKVLTGTSVFSSAQPVPAGTGRGLAGRQRGQAIKRSRRARPDASK